MSWARALAFNLAFFAWTAILGTIGLPFLLTPRAVTMRFGRFWAASVLVLLRLIVGLDHEVRGLDRLPRGGCIIAMKHQSAWDALILPVVLGDPAVVVKRELLLLPFYGWYAARAGSIAIDRKAGAGALRRMLARARPVAAAGRPIVIFPEGTRVAPGERRALSARRRRALSGIGAAAGAGGGQFRPLLGPAQLRQTPGPHRPRISRTDPARGEPARASWPSSNGGSRPPPPHCCARARARRLPGPR